MIYSLFPRNDDFWEQELTIIAKSPNATAARTRMIDKLARISHRQT